MTALRPYHAAILFLVALLLYLLTGAPGLTTEDSAELTFGARFLSMVHPPGYPLYLLLGRLACLFDDLTGAFPGRGLVLLSSFAAAASVAIVYLALRRPWGPGPATIAAASLVVLRGAWDAAIIVEVYALQTALFAGMLFVLLRLRDEPTGRNLQLAAFLTGLMLAHHVGVLILLPFLALFLAHQARPFPVGALVPATGFLLLPLALYAALPLLSARDAMPVSWWPPITEPGQLLHTALGGGFRRLLFAVPLDEVARNLVTLPLTLAGWLNIVSLLLALLGVVDLARRDRPLLALLGAIILTTILHAANYDVLDPESFLLPAVVPLAFLVGAGFRVVEPRIAGRGIPVEAVAVLIIVVGVAGRLANGSLMTQAVKTMPLDVARAVLAAHDASPGSTPDPTPAHDTSMPKAVIWADWHLYPTLKWVQVAEGLGRDVLVELDTTAESPGVTYLPGRTWVMHPSRSLGALHPLRMENLHWRVLEPGQELLPAPVPTATATRPPPALVRAGPVAVVGIETPAVTGYGRIVNVMVLLSILPDTSGRGLDGDRTETVSGSLILFRNGQPRLSTPFAPLAWHTLPARPRTGAADTSPTPLYAEPVQILVPTTYAADPESTAYRLALELRVDGDANRLPLLDLGPLRLESRARK